MADDDTKETSLTAARALFSAPPEPEPAKHTELEAIQHWIPNVDPTKTVSVLKFAVEELERSAKYTDQQSARTATPGVRLELEELYSDLKKALEAGEIVGYGEPIVEKDRDIYNRRLVVRVRVKVAVPDSNKFAMNVEATDPVEQERIKQLRQLYQDVSKELRDNPKAQVIEVIDPFEKTHSRDHMTDALSFAAQCQQTLPIHAYCSSVTVPDVASKPKVGEYWTNGNEIVKILMIDTDVIRVEKTRGQWTFEEHVSKVTLDVGWKSIQSIEGKPVPRVHERWANEYGTQVVVTKTEISLSNMFNSSQIYYSGAVTYGEIKHRTLKSFWKIFSLASSETVPKSESLTARSMPRPGQRWREIRGDEGKEVEIVKLTRSAMPADSIVHYKGIGLTELSYRDHLGDFWNTFAPVEQESIRLKL